MCSHGDDCRFCEADHIKSLLLNCVQDELGGFE
jgi:hypothetical protein